MRSLELTARERVVFDIVLMAAGGALLTALVLVSWIHERWPFLAAMGVFLALVGPLCVYISRTRRVTIWSVVTLRPWPRRED
jgi:hypothetical protein